MKNVINTQKLIEARGERSRSAVAAEIGVTRQQIWNYENGTSEPPISVLCDLARFYKIDLNDLLNDKNFSIASN